MTQPETTTKVKKIYYTFTDRQLQRNETCQHGV